MPTAQEFISFAREQIGVSEYPPGTNMNPFARAAGHANGQPWCATFVVAVARAVGLTLPSESAYTPTMFNGFVQANRGFRPNRGTKIQPGDVVFFDFPDSKARIQHVGIAIDHESDKGVICIEGNTSSTSSGSQDNGGGVYVRNRPLSHVAGFGRPNFAAAPVAAQPSKEPAVAESYPCKAQVQSFVPLYNQATGQVYGYYIVTADGEVFGFSAPGFNLPYLGRVDTAAIS